MSSDEKIGRRWEKVLTAVGALIMALCWLHHLDEQAFNRDGARQLAHAERLCLERGGLPAQNAQGVFYCMKPQY